MHLGIVFGTCSSSAAFTHDEMLTPIKDSSSLHFPVPSSIFLVHQEQVLVDRIANNQRMCDPLLLGDHSYLLQELIALPKVSSNERLTI
jgi:hypothetical protein